MILLEIDGFDVFFMIASLYLIAHLPALILLLLGFIFRNKNPKTAKIFFIIAGVYFVVGAGICGAIISGG